MEFEGDKMDYFVMEQKDMSKDQGLYTVVAPMHLRNLSEICEMFGVGERTVKKWKEEGAPIVFDRKYSAEYNALQKWRVEGN